MPTGTYVKPGQPYFFLNGHLHRILREIKHEDKVITFDFDDRREVVYLGEDLERKREKAYSYAEACALLRHGRIQIWRAFTAGDIPQGHVARPPGSNRMQSPRFWTADELLQAWKYFASTHIGRPGRSGDIKNNMPTRAEFRAELEGRKQMYIIGDNGEPVPVWKEY